MFWSPFRALCVLACLGSCLVGWTASALVSHENDRVAYLLRTDRSGSQMNWLGGQLEVVGVGFAPGKEAYAQWKARTSAMAVLVHEASRALAPIRFDNGMFLGPALDSADPKTKVELQKFTDDLVANIEIIDEIWDEAHGTYAVVGRLPLYGAQSLATLGIRLQGTFHPLDLPGSLVTINAPIPRGCTPQHFTAPYTGVIINGDDALLSPCVFPHILRFDGKELWGPASITSASVENGSVLYATNLDIALQRKLAGARPLVLTAIGNGLGCYPVINLDDTYLVLTQQKATHLLERLPIVITLGQKN